VRNQAAKPKFLKCAIYTRKSSEEGLEQDFNSLHAQRESCEAYIKSQKHEGWVALPVLYDDGGYSGGSIERPALKKLLTDIQSRAVDVVVVYKVDRLTRSLADFAKIVEIFDAAGVSFVSVTQQFNTTTSMGRLTLNVLLSFAQFEREVTGERIRDKIAASKQKGMWMGGWVPIGYDRKDRTLTINEDEAKTVRTIFELFLKLKNVREVQIELARLKLTTKPYPISTGRILGGLPFSRGHIYRILSNPLYIGEIAHKDIRHAGQHPRIIDQDIWDAVSALIGSNRREHRARSKAGHANLLAGLIYDEGGRRLVSSHTTKNGKRYLYYITSDGSGRKPAPAAQAKSRLPAADVDEFVVSAIRTFLTDNTGLAKLLRAAHVRSGKLAEALKKAEATGRQLEAMPFRSRLELVTCLVARIDVLQASLRITFRIAGVVRYLSGSENLDYPQENDTVFVDFPVPTILQNGAVKLVVTQPSQKSEDASLIAAIARGTCWFEELTSGKASSISGIASRENVTDSYVSRLLNLALLSPTIVHQVLDGGPAAVKLARHEMTGQRLSALWSEQRVSQSVAWSRR
jgi:DNA invertase Pin-like site-specific DNA recombinase